MFRSFVAFVTIILMLSPGFTNVFALDPLERAPLSSAQLVNSFGNPVFEFVNTNQQVQISADVSNNQDVNQPFVYIVQIKNQNGIIVKLEYIISILGPGQSLTLAKSWIPKEPGTYTAQIFVWESLSNAEPLSEPKQIKITAS